MTILEAETGSGKTEAALARFVQLFDAGLLEQLHPIVEVLDRAAHLLDDLYFAQPTRSAAQLDTRVFAAAQRALSTRLSSCSPCLDCEEADEIHVLDAGLDDYPIRPHGIGELLPRMRIGTRWATSQPVETLGA